MDYKTICRQWLCLVALPLAMRPITCVVIRRMTDLSRVVTPVCESPIERSNG